ncbi:MAG: hypothetical protein KGY57_03225 [Gammaproteobacteria bacterium]|nr:hypothetical protein [Gammaproteobacteria bacterium]
MDHSHRESGQILPVLFAVIAIGLAAFTLADRVATAMSDQSRVTDAADSAAYSAAVWTARRLNFMAYTNRAILANHLSVGHVTAYISWLRYIEDAVDRIHQISKWLAVTGILIKVELAVAAMRSAIGKGVRVNEMLAGGYIFATNAYNKGLTAAQVDALTLLEPRQIQRLQERIVTGHDSSFSVNSIAALNALPGQWGNLTTALIAKLYWDLTQTLDMDFAPRNDPFMQNIVDRTISHDPRLERWLSNSDRRGWQVNLVNVVKIRKQGNSERPPDHPADVWKSSDSLQWSLFDGFPFGWGGWSTLAGGQADAVDLAGSYSGITSYVRIDPDSDTHPRFIFPALVTTDDERTNARLSLAAVEYQIPPRCGGSACPNADDPATLFNPYWNARLISPAQVIDG